MVEMLAKWAGKCKVCGRVILPGSSMDWTKDGGAKHVTDVDCAAAPESILPVVLRGPQPERSEVMFQRGPRR